VGDDSYSFAVDLYRRLTWNGYDEFYSNIHWQKGDIISVLLDLDNNDDTEQLKDEVEEELKIIEDSILYSDCKPDLVKLRKELLFHKRGRRGFA
jgi:hypothetical protein